jgi:co-chaperonin GroES (HSP10)
MSASVLDLSMIPTPAIKAAPKVTGVHPLGSNILIELLNTQELTSNQIIVAEGTGTTDGPPQAYVIEVGPSVTCPEIKALVGKRVVVNGRGVNVPDFDGHSRIRLLVEYPMIKAVLDEGEHESSLIKSTCCRLA